MAKISVIIPVYNVEKYLRQCLDSVVNQTFSDLEIICVDDCSTDNSLSILKEYASKDSRITIIEQKENQGAGLARNKGLEIANSEYIMFLDPDDWYEHDTCEKTYNKIAKNNNDIVNFKHKKFFEKSGEFKEENSIITPFLPFIDEPNIDLNKLDINWIANCMSTHYIFKKEFLISNNILFPSFKLCEDGLFMTKVFCYVQSVAAIDESLYNYRIRLSKNNLSWDVNLWKDLYNAKTKALEFVENLNIENIVVPHLLFYVRALLYWLNRFYNNMTLYDKYKFYNILHYKFVELEAKYHISAIPNARFNHELYNQVLKYNYLQYILRTKFAFHTYLSKNKTHKVINFLGLKFKFRIKKAENNVK